jgi:hypothetical protein
VGAQQAEVPGLLGGNLEPVQVIGARHAGKAPDGIQGQVDGI